MELFDVYDDESRIIWSEIHLKYENIIESFLEEFCKQYNIINTILYKELSEAAESNDAHANTLVNIIIAQVLYNILY